MKSFIERVFMAKKNKKQEEIIDETITTEVKEQATEAAVEAIIKKVKQDSVEVQHTDRKDD
ncbi:hypothetical protein EB001_17875 [bacterium]|nr:hypothetical protein [bacterium]